MSYLLGNFDQFVTSYSYTEVQARQLEATFLNCKGVPVTVWDMRVVFYKESQQLAAGETPHAASPSGPPVAPPVGPVNLPPHVPITQTMHVATISGWTEQLRAAEQADRVEFVASIDGANDVRKEIALWGQLPNGAQPPLVPKPYPRWRFWR